jgi:hypothetical protein
MEAIMAEPLITESQLAQLLAKEIKKTGPIRCVIDTANDAAEISLDEDVTRENLHPADEFERFRELSQDRGWGAEEIAIRFGTSAHVVKQRLRLGAVSPTLIQVYRDGGLTMDQLQPFAIIATGRGFAQARGATAGDITHADAKIIPTSDATTAHAGPCAEAERHSCLRFASTGRLGAPAFSCKRGGCGSEAAEWLANAAGFHMFIIHSKEPQKWQESAFLVSITSRTTRGPARSETLASSRATSQPPTTIGNR